MKLLKNIKNVFWQPGSELTLWFRVSVSYLDCHLQSSLILWEFASIINIMTIILFS